MKKRILSILLTLALVCGLLPAGIVQAAIGYDYTDTYPVEGGDPFLMRRRVKLWALTHPSHQPTSRARSTAWL